MLVFCLDFCIAEKKKLSLSDEIRLYDAMKYDVRDIIEYVIALIDEFGKHFGLSEKQAYSYINAHKGIAFIEQHYGIMHTLDFKEAVEYVALFCRKTGGEL